ncbi:hypothetical protein [Sulfitobacter sabulilitoris]|uniref:Endonuclease n=1 Tax=Sulfitobacter sabulilitoris TaxID=2562655 RepID=A0A5S3PKL2_9RHOB|nr:hypothetical protein [Sulfitobacter sabulilitoris]TMM54949.1 hypothetical protein FDT80_05060 [Sulfitobacter sabulilitoris]
MNNNQGMIGCALGCWMVAAAVGVLTAVLLWVLGDWSFMQGAFGGIVVAVASGLVVSLILCKPLPGPNEVKLETPILGEDTKPAAAKPAAAKPAAVDAPASSPVSARTSAIKPSAPLKGQEDLAARKGSWKYEGQGAAKPAAATQEPAKPAAQADTPARAPVAADGKPEMLEAPRAGGADDLKRISGVGPKIEQTLNALGVYHYDQVASWRKKEIAWVDEQLRFKGRIERDGWIAQAKTLAKGGETEVSKRKKKS